MRVVSLLVHLTESSCRTGTNRPPEDDRNDEGPAGELIPRYATLEPPSLGEARRRCRLHTARRNQRLPDVRLETSYRGNGLGGTEFLRSGGFPGLVTGTRNRGFDDALGQVFTNDYPAWSVGLTVSYPLGRSYEAASHARADVERRQAAQRVASLRLQVAETVRRAGRQVRSTAERVEAARASATLAEERLRAEQRRFEAGLSTTFLVTQAQRDLLEAEVNLLETMLEYESALVTFEAVQLAPPPAAGDTVGASSAPVVLLSTPTPRGIFRSGANGGF